MDGLVFHMLVHSIISVLLLITLAHFEDVLGLLFRLFDFFPSLKESYLKKVLNIAGAALEKN